MRYIEHLVLLKLQRPFNEQELERIMSLTSIAGVCWISCGENYTKRGLGYNYGIAVRFTREEAEVAYQTHPLHVAVRDEVIKPLIDATQPNPILAMDYAHEQAPRLKLAAVSFALGLLVGVLVKRRK